MLHFHGENLASFLFGALWHTGKVSCLCIRRVLTCLHCDKLKPTKVLIHIAYTGKPMLLGDMDQDNYTAMIVHIIKHEYAPTTIALGAYLYYKVKSFHN